MLKIDVEKITNLYDVRWLNVLLECMQTGVKHEGLVEIDG